METTEENKTSAENQNPTVEKNEKEKYFEALRCWLHEAQVFQHINASFPFYFFARQMTYQQDSTNNTLYLNNNYQPPFAFMQNNINRGQQNDLQGRNGVEDTDARDGLEFVIPPLWKRFLAEQVDFLILLCIKLVIYYVLREQLDFLDLTKYIDVDVLSKRLQEDYVFAFEMTSDIILFESTYRLIVCLFEALCMYATLQRGPGGATPGKAIFGLRVVTATKIYPVRNRLRETVLVSPGGNLTFATALKRAATKNALIAFLFPVFTLTFFTKHNRTAYDVLCNVLVVEENANPPRQRLPF